MDLIEKYLGEEKSDLPNRFWAISESAYSDFIKAGNKDEDWEAYQKQKNMDFRKQSEHQLITKWKEGEELSGNSIVNFLRTKHIHPPTSLNARLDHNDTYVSKTSAKGRGMGRLEAKKIHNWVSIEMNKFK
jgi:hypothetical protein